MEPSRDKAKMVVPLVPEAQRILPQVTVTPLVPSILSFLASDNSFGTF